MWYKTTRASKSGKESTTKHIHWRKTNDYRNQKRETCFHDS